MSQCPHEDGGAKQPGRGTSGNVSDLRPPWGDSAAKAAAESASAEAHAEFAHRLPDAVTKAGTERALRVMRIARTAQKKPLNVDIQNQFAPAHHICA